MTRLAGLYADSPAPGLRLLAPLGKRRNRTNNRSTEGRPVAGQLVQGADGLWREQKEKTK